MRVTGRSELSACQPRLDGAVVKTAQDEGLADPFKFHPSPIARLTTLSGEGASYRAADFNALSLVELLASLRGTRCRRSRGGSLDYESLRKAPRTGQSSMERVLDRAPY